MSDMKITGELTLRHPNDVLTSLNLTAEDMWALKASVAEMEKKAVNEPGFANGHGKAAIINLHQKLKVAYETADAEMGCVNPACRCKK